MYTLKIKFKDLRSATDMLRYDACYKATPVKAEFENGVIELETVDFTQDRWESFGVAPTVVYSEHTPSKQKEELYEQARGFRMALLFAGWFNRQEQQSGYPPANRFVEGDY